MDFCEKLKWQYDSILVDLTDKKSGSAYGPSEFLWLIKNAQYVVTDSFHGTIFSVLFGKQFSLFERKGEDAHIFSRLETLMNLLKLNDRIFNIEQPIAHTEKYDVSLIVKHEIDKAYKYLENALKN